MTKATKIKLALIAVVLGLMFVAGSDIDPGVKRGLELLLTNLLSGLAL